MNDGARSFARASGIYRREVDRKATSNVAHDLCNQLQVVESALSLIRGSLDTAAATALEEIFGYARSAVERAGFLTRAIVDAKSHTATTNCRISIVERLSSMPELSMLASSSNIVVEHFIAADVPDVVCDPLAFADAILNIVVNARRAMPNGGRILISASREVAAFEGFPLAVLRIADTGCGMSPEIAARAFEPSFTTRPRGEGSGLGLAMVADFARSAGGCADLDSRVGCGTVITIRLPGWIKPVGELRAES
jgi:signal transduction histidine kinase